MADCFYRSIQYRTFVILGKKINYIIIHLYVIIVIILNIILGGDVEINFKWSFEIYEHHTGLQFLKLIMYQETIFLSSGLIDRSYAHELQRVCS